VGSEVDRCGGDDPYMGTLIEAGRGKSESAREYDSYRNFCIKEGCLRFLPIKKKKLHKAASSFL
jgi:hypothetical protein